MTSLFAWRYFKAKKSTNAINIIAWISIGAIVVGTTALILVLSVFNGFEDLVKSLYSSFYTDLKITSMKGKTVTLSPQQLQQLRGISGIKNFSLVVEEKSLVQNGDYQSLVILKGVDENYKYVSGVANNILRGAYDLGNVDAPRLVVGSGVEGALGIQADRNIFALMVRLPRFTSGVQLDPLEAFSSDSVQTSAVFQIQQDFDNKYGITNIDFMKRALRLAPDQYTGVEVVTVDPRAADDVSKEIQKMLGGDYRVQTRYQQNEGLYSVMNMERRVIYAVLCLILVVAAFNMIGALRLLVLEKQKDIGVLHAMGAKRKFIQNIFLNEGLLLALIGTVTGMLLAFIIAVLQMKFHLIPLQGGSFLIDYFPVKLRLTDFLLVSGTVFVVAVIASWLPSRRASAHEYSLRAE